MNALSDVDPATAKLWHTEGHEHDVISSRLLGFWLYMLGDSLIFAALFAAYGVLSYDMSAAGGPMARDVVHPIRAYVQTVILFGSALCYGFAMVELKNSQPKRLMCWLAAALVLGIGFIAMEWYELADLIGRGIVPQRSGYLSIFFALVGVHGIHIAVGLLWMVVMLLQVGTKGLTALVTYRLANLKIFWVYQSLIWSFVYTFVYLRGAIS